MSRFERTSARRRHRIPYDALWIDEEKTSERDTLLLDENVVVARDLHVPVGDQREFQVGPETALLPRLLPPGKVRVLRVGRDAWVNVSNRYHCRCVRGRPTEDDGV